MTGHVPKPHLLFIIVVIVVNCSHSPQRMVLFNRDENMIWVFAPENVRRLAAFSSDSFEQPQWTWIERKVPNMNAQILHKISSAHPEACVQWNHSALPGSFLPDEINYTPFLMNYRSFVSLATSGEKKCSHRDNVVDALATAIDAIYLYLLIEGSRKKNPKVVTFHLKTISNTLFSSTITPETMLMLVKCNNSDEISISIYFIEFDVCWFFFLWQRVLLLRLAVKRAAELSIRNVIF